MTTCSDREPVPIRVPGKSSRTCGRGASCATDGCTRSASRRTGGPGDSLEPAEYRVWVRASQHVRPVDGVSYDDVPTEYLEPPTVVEQTLGPRRPSGWVLAKAGGHGPGRGVVHAVDCKEVPDEAPVLALERALDAAQRPGTRLCSLCAAAAELDPVLKGFDRGFDGEGFGES